MNNRITGDDNVYNQLDMSGRTLLEFNKWKQEKKKRQKKDGKSHLLPTNFFFPMLP